MENRLLYFICLLLLITNVFLLTNYLLYPVISDDSGYYLSIARDMYLNNKVYFVDIGTNYNPIAILFYGIPFLFWTSPPFWTHLIIVFFFRLLSTYLFYKILSYINRNLTENAMYSLYFLLLEMVLDGRHILLESVTVFFMLFALLIYLEYKQKQKQYLLLLTGVLISLAFLSKQYGLLILIPIGYDLLIEVKLHLNKLFLLLIGLLLPVVIFYLYLSIYGISVSTFLMSILGKGVKLDNGTGTSISTSFFTYPMDTIYVILFNLYILLIPFLLYKSGRKTKLDGLYILSFFSSLLVLYFANYWHYYQLIIPFSLFLFIVLISDINNKKKHYYHYAIVLSTIIIIGYKYSLLRQKTNNSNLKLENRNILLRAVPAGSKVYLDGIATSYYYSNNYHSIDSKNISYTFPGYFNPKTIVKYFDKGEYIIVSEKKMKQYKDVLNEKFTTNKVSINNKNYYIVRNK